MGIMYAMVCTQPDIAQVVSIVSKYTSNPSKTHWLANQWILRYLRVTSSTCIEYGRNNNGLYGHANSGYSGDLDERKSTLGYVF